MTRQHNVVLWFKHDVNLGLYEAGTENLIVNLRVLVTGTGANFVVCTLEPPGSWYSQ